MENEIDKLVANNTGLIYRQLHKFHMAYDDDAFSIGLEALASAAVTYDEAKNVRFSTYASVCIYNAIGNYLRGLNKKRKIDVVLYDDRVPGAGDLTLYDVLSVGASPEEECLEKELYAKLWDAFNRILLDMPSGIEQNIILSWRTSDFTKTQTAIAKEVGTSQAHVSRTLSAFKHKLKKELEDYIC